MGFPTENVVSKGASLRMQIIPENSSRPTQYTITNSTAATRGASSLQLASNANVILHHNEVLRFPNGASWLVNNVNGYQRRGNGIEIDTADATPVRPVVGNKLRFANHDTIYTVASVSGTGAAANLGLNPTLRQPVGDDAVIEVLVEAIVDIPQGQGLNDIVRLTTTAAAVPVTPIPADIPINAAALTYGLLELIGLTDVSPTEAPQTQDGTDHKRALKGLQVTISTVTSKTVTITGNKLKNDRCLATVVMPILNDPDLQGFSVWAELISSDGDFRSGIAQITDASAGDTATNLKTFNVTLTFNDDFTYISGDTALFAVAA